MTKQIFIVPIEPLENRYTGQWYNHLPILLDNYAKDNGIDIDVINVEGEEVPTITMPGAFLDFGATNIYKSSQLQVIADHFRNGYIKPNATFVYTDAWNPTVIQLKYMAELFQIPIKIHGLWHAGSWDKQDFLGRLIGNATWINYSELSMIHCFDTNWVATKFHADLIGKKLFKVNGEDLLQKYDFALTGWPMDYLKETLSPYKKLPKKHQIVFPHRLAPEKQVEIFRDLASRMPEYTWVVCQDKNLTKQEYHTILGQSKLALSVSLQETLGISMGGEAPLANCIPLVPKRLSYQEVFNGYNDFMYPNSWTKSWDDYVKHRDELMTKIRHMMNYYDDLLPKLHDFVDKRFEIYFHATPLVEKLVKG